MDDAEGLSPQIRNVVAITGLATDVMVNSELAIALQSDPKFWDIRNDLRVTLGGAELGSLNDEGLDGFHWHTVCLQKRKSEEELGNRMGLEHAAKNVWRRRWKKWLESGMSGAVMQARLDELDDGYVGAGWMELGRSQRKAQEKVMRRYLLVDGSEARLFFRENNGELASCVLENDVPVVLASLHEGHGYFTNGITLGRACEPVYWPSHAYNVGRWVSSCEPCHRVPKMQRSGELGSIIQFKPMDMIGMDFVGPISPPCKAASYSYILIVITYFSRFLWAIGVRKADQASTMKALLDHIFPIVRWLLTVYSDNWSHFTGGLISDM